MRELWFLPRAVPRTREAINLIPAPFGQRRAIRRVPSGPRGPGFLPLWL